jgi:hypothetical protein
MSETDYTLSPLGFHRVTVLAIDGRGVRRVLSVCKGMNHSPRRSSIDGFCCLLMDTPFSDPSQPIHNAISYKEGIFAMGACGGLLLF